MSLCAKEDADRGNLPVDSGGQSRVKHTEIESTAAGLPWTQGSGTYF